LTYEDVVAFGRMCDDGDWPDENRLLVLCKAHWSDLLLDRKRFGDQMINYKKGMPLPMILGFEIHKYVKNPIYTAARVKKPYGSVQEPTDREASVAYYLEAVTKKPGVTRQYFTPAVINPTRQSNDLSYRHYFVAVPFKNERIGAII